ncbi:hypothetical protein [Candidatus Bandiella numerosa]|nr:hypothetical protein [Candidatus Bandiella numerosa]
MSNVLGIDVGKADIMVALLVDKGRCINAKQGRYAINEFKKLDSYKEER